MKSWLWLLLTAVVVGSGCSQQPYRVFAVQVAGPPPPEAMAAPAGAGSAGVQPVVLGLPTAPQAKAQSREAAAWDLNQVSAAALATLPGIDAATVQAILAHRPYRSKRELLTRHVLSPAQYARWKADLVVHRSDTKGPAPRR